MLSANLSRFFVYAGFAFNKNYIAVNLCENRDKPMLHCNGKCYLAKKLKQTVEKEKNQERESKKNSFQEAFIALKKTIRFYPKFIKIITIAELPFVLSKHSATIFQPPQV